MNDVTEDGNSQDASGDPMVGQATSSSSLTGLLNSIRRRVVVLNAKVVFSFWIALGGLAQVNLVLGGPAGGPSGFLAIRIGLWAAPHSRRRGSQSTRWRTSCFTAQ